MDPFMSLKTAWPSLLTAEPRTFSFPESHCVSTQWTVFLIEACSLAHFKIFFCKNMLFNKHHTFLVVGISEMKLDDFYHSGFWDYCLHLYCYIHNVLTDVSSGLLQMFLVKLGSLHRTSNHILYLIHEGHLLTITGYKCNVFLYCYLLAVRIEPATSRWLSLWSLGNQWL